MWVDCGFVAIVCEELCVRERERERDRDRERERERYSSNFQIFVSSEFSKIV